MASRSNAPGTRILLTGASGFLGQHVLHPLRCSGYAVVNAGRKPLPGAVHETLAFTAFAHDFRVSDWVPRLYGIDPNAVGS
jgi:uncharacterized protein YbjT (DUF2867 family)